MCRAVTARLAVTRGRPQSRFGLEAKLVEVLARVGELDIGAFLGAAAVADVGHKHVRQAVQIVRGAAGTSHADGGTVHVHFSVADLVEPGPGDGVVAGAELLTYLEIIRVRDLACRGPALEVARLIFGRAAAFNRLDDLPHAVLGWLQVGCERDLA